MRQLVGRCGSDIEKARLALSYCCDALFNYQSLRNNPILTQNIGLNTNYFNYFSRITKLNDDNFKVKNPSGTVVLCNTMYCATVDHK